MVCVVCFPVYLFNTLKRVEAVFRTSHHIGWTNVWFYFIWQNWHQLWLPASCTSDRDLLFVILFFFFSSWLAFAYSSVCISAPLANVIVHIDKNLILPKNTSKKESVLISIFKNHVFNLNKRDKGSIKATQMRVIVGFLGQLPASWCHSCCWPWRVTSC